MALAQAAAMSSVGEDVDLGRNPGLHQGVVERERLFDRTVWSLKVWYMNVGGVSLVTNRSGS